MDSKQRNWRFGLTWLFVAMLAGAICATVWINHQATWAVASCWAMSLVMPAGAASGSVFFRGYLRAFFIGTTITLLLYANETIRDTESVLVMLTHERVTENLLARSPSSVYFADATEGMARRTVFVTGISLLSGLFAVFICWLARERPTK